MFTRVKRQDLRRTTHGRAPTESLTVIGKQNKISNQVDINDINWKFDRFKLYRVSRQVPAGGRIAIPPVPRNRELRLIPYLVHLLGPHIPP